MDNPVLLVYGILFLLITLYLVVDKSNWSMFTGIISLVLILVYLLVPDKESPPITIDTKSSTIQSTISPVSPANPVGVLHRFIVGETLRSPILRSTFNYINDPQKDDSSGRLEYSNDRNMHRWGINVINYTHIRIDGKIFKLRNPNSSDSYGYFVDKFGNQQDSPPENFFTYFIEIGTFS
jgi:hypothetical protein